jgi:hypothetical protein
MLGASHRQRRVRKAVLAAGSLAASAAMAVAMTMLPASAAGFSRTMAGPTPSVKAGPTGTPIVVGNHVELSGYDLATDTAGTAYLGWISDSSGSNSDRIVHLCVLPLGAKACQGGVMSTASLGVSSAAGLRVIATSKGHVTLVWFHDTTSSGTVSNGGRIATATYQSGGSLSAATDQANAPSFGALLSANLAPGGAIWAVTQNSSSAGQKIQVYQGLGATPKPLTAPYFVGHAWLAFAGNKPILAIDQYGAISQPVGYTSENGSTWTGFKKVAHTWNVGGAVGMVAAKSGVRLVASVDTAGYYPVVARWMGSKFSTPKLTGDKNACAPNSHDLVTDASGRIADVTNECGKITVADLANTTKAGIVRFSAGGTVAGGNPQIATTPRGHAWVAWAIESTTANKLEVVPAMLPALSVSKTGSSGAGSVVVTGPASCLPAVVAPAKLKVKAASGWKVKSKSLKIGGKAVKSGKIDGGSLSAGTLHSLVGQASFVRSGAGTKTVKVTLSFRSCPKP